MISLKEAREQKGWSVEELASAAGVDTATIEAIEAGERRPTSSLGLTIARRLGKSVKEIAELAPQTTGMLGGGADPLLGPRVGP